MQLVIETGPLYEPITIHEMKLHLRVDGDDYDTQKDVENIIKPAREHVEEILSRKLITQTWNYYLDAFPSENYFKIPYGNLQSVTYVRYTDSDGDVTTMTVGDEYIVETNGDQCGRIVLPYSVSWPSFTAYPSNPIQVQYVCGWTSAASVPEKIKAAIKLVCGDLFVNRESRMLSALDYRENKTVMNLLYSSILRDNY